MDFIPIVRDIAAEEAQNDGSWLGIHLPIIDSARKWLTIPIVDIELDNWEKPEQDCEINGRLSVPVITSWPGWRDAPTEALHAKKGCEALLVGRDPDAVSLRYTIELRRFEP